jgi:hypothetical protein
MRIHLHIGAHKTATTFIQQAFQQNRSALNKAGIGYMPLRVVREKFTGSYDELSPSARIDDYLGDCFEGDVPAGITGLILSDENFFGTTRQSIPSGILYPLAAERARALRQLLAGHEVTVFLCIRSYDDFIASLYGEALRWGSFLRFEVFRRRLDFESFRWSNYYGRSVRLLHPANFKLWRYEDFRPNSERIIRSIAFDTDVPLNIEHSDVNPSLSHNAILHLHDLARTLTAEEVADRVREVHQLIPKTAGNGAFDPWSDKERSQLRQTYDLDCSTVPDHWWLLKPLAKTAAA